MGELKRRLGKTNGPASTDDEFEELFMFGLLSEPGVAEDYKWRLEDVTISWGKVLEVNKGEAAKESRSSLVLLIGMDGRIAWKKE